MAIAVTRASYRRHRLWRSLTRTRYLVAALLVVVVVVFALDKSHQPPGCHFVETPTGKGSFVATRVCPGKQQRRAATHGRPSYREEVALWLGLVLLIPTGIYVVPRAIRLRDDLAIRRSRHR